MRYSQSFTARPELAKEFEMSDPSRTYRLAVYFSLIALTSTLGWALWSAASNPVVT